MKDVSGTFDFGENFIRFGGPGKRARVRVVGCDERLDGFDQFRNVAERAATQSLRA